MVLVDLKKADSTRSGSPTDIKFCVKLSAKVITRSFTDSDSI